MMMMTMAKTIIRHLSTNWPRLFMNAPDRSSSPSELAAFPQNQLRAFTPANSFIFVWYSIAYWSNVFWTLNLHSITILYISCCTVDSTCTGFVRYFYLHLLSPSIMYYVCIMYDNVIPSSLHSTALSIFVFVFVVDCILIFTFYYGVLSSSPPLLYC